MTLLAQERLAQDEELYKKRHSLAHVMAEAVLQIFPTAQIAIGPPVSDGFYYDFELPRSLTPEDLPQIEEKMREILKSGASFVREEISRDEANDLFQNQKYKLELLQTFPPHEKISIYKSHQFVDLCRGPHVDSMKELDPGSFKLDRLAGAYWRGDSQGPMLQRIYAVCFFNAEQLKEYLEWKEEAERRDHRKLGVQLDLFHLDDENPGQVFWHPKGWTLYRILVDYIRKKIEKDGYQEVHTPSVMPKSLWERSGHWAKYQENMFVTESEKRLFAIKPMNCPGHVEIFRQSLKSYRDLPLRLAEFGSCVRNEPSGALHGIMRVRGFVQDDGHIFCAEDQVEAEVKKFCELLADMYRDLGFDPKNVLVRLALRPEKRLGDDSTWDKAERALGQASRAAGFDYVEAPGEGAFYGPKLEFTLIDALGRKWQCGTIQLDYQLLSPDRLNATYIGVDGQKHHPVMLHRAVLGSLERFIGILIEHYAGAFPVWLAPIQAIVIPVAPSFSEYAQKVTYILKQENIRAEADLSDERMNNKIRLAQGQKVPYMLVVGAKEQEAKAVSIRTRKNEQENLVPLQDFIDRLKKESRIGAQ
jgi:threonyl-tRNA synthetase